MDMTAMQFEDEFFGAVVDKGGLDALMEPKLGPTLGNQYLSEVSIFFYLFISMKHRHKHGHWIRHLTCGHM